MFSVLRASKTSDANPLRRLPTSVPTDQPFKRHANKEYALAVSTVRQWRHKGIGHPRTWKLFHRHRIGEGRSVTGVRDGLVQGAADNGNYNAPVVTWPRYGPQSC